MKRKNRATLWTAAIVCGAVGLLLLGWELLRMFNTVVSGQPPVLRIGAGTLLAGLLIVAAIISALAAMWAGYREQQESRE